MTTKLLLPLLFLFYLKVSGQCSGDVIIPDVNFKNSLLLEHDIDTNSDGEISCDEAASFTGVIRVSSRNISDMTGIEAFVSVENIRCSENYVLTNLDISSNLALKDLSCGNNSLTSLDISANTQLESLSFHNNNITSLDTSNNLNLEYLYCAGNSLTSLDVSNNTLLKYLNCRDNNLSSLNIANGNLFYDSGSSFENNSELFCIQVSDVDYANANWSTLKGYRSSYSEDCGEVFNLSVNADNGIVSAKVDTFDGVASEDGTYPYGTIVRLTAEPNEGYEFIGWSGDISATGSVITVTMDSDKNITALFALTEHTLQFGAQSGTGTGFSLDVHPNTDGTYSYGTIVELTAIPGEGYEFVGWSGDGSGTDNPLTVVMLSLIHI